MAGWHHEKLGPCIEVPLSIAPDHVWLEAHTAHLASLPEPPPIGIEVGHAADDHFGSLLTITVPTWTEGPVTNPPTHVPESVVVSPARSWTIAEALDWLADYIDQVNARAVAIHHSLQIVENEAAAWWEERSIVGLGILATRSSYSFHLPIRPTLRGLPPQARNGRESSRSVGSWG